MIYYVFCFVFIRFAGQRTGKIFFAATVVDSCALLVDACALILATMCWAVLNLFVFPAPKSILGMVNSLNICKEQTEIKFTWLNKWAYYFEEKRKPSHKNDRKLSRQLMWCMFVNLTLVTDGRDNHSISKTAGLNNRSSSRIDRAVDFDQGQ